jgi:hypothetical protein
MAFVPQLLAGLPELEILTDKNDYKFQEHTKRWSDIDRKIPAAIVLPASEEQIQQTVGKAAYNCPHHSPIFLSADPLGAPILGAVRHEERGP